MAIKSIIGAVCTSAILMMATPFFHGTAIASTINTANSTLTTYDVSSGNVSFEWDLNSQYDITGTSVTLYTNDIMTSGLRIIGTLYEFVIPNFYDPLPLKRISVTMEGSNPNASSFDIPRVLDIIGADSDYDNGGPALPVLGTFVSATMTPTFANENWEMRPNPDFETVKIYAPIGFELHTIMIDTQSMAIPIPASIWLFGSGLLGLVAISRKMKT